METQVDMGDTVVPGRSSSSVELCCMWKRLSTKEKEK